MPRRSIYRRNTSALPALAVAIAAGFVACNGLTGAGDIEVVASVPDAHEPEPLPSVTTDTGYDPPPPRDASTSDYEPPPPPPPEPKRVFVTSAAWAGNALGGVEGADTKCREAAKQAGLGDGPWVAWLSTTQKNALARITFVGGYKLIDGGIVATSPGELGSGTLRLAINITENGTPAATTDDLLSAVWTGTVAGGAAVSTEPSKLCSDWTGGTASAVGSSFRTDAEWTYAIAGLCTSAARLYCFEL